MAQYVADNSLSIGNTPMVKINRMAQGLKATVFAKIEGRNPAYSVKCRIGANMIWTAEKNGLVKPGMEIIEATSGNTGIALAYVAAARGYRLHVTMPETMSIERRKVLAIFGTHVILTPGPKGMRGAIEEAERIAASDPKYFMPQQFQESGQPGDPFQDYRSGDLGTDKRWNGCARRRGGHGRHHYRGVTVYKEREGPPYHQRCG